MRSNEIGAAPTSGPDPILIPNPDPDVIPINDSRGDLP
jgi:hypothetical protein